MDFGRSLTFVTRDPQWVAKLLIGVAISLIPFIGHFFLIGYCLEVTRRVYAGDERLPEWDQFGDYFVQGFLLSVGLLIWSIPLIAVFACVGVLATIGGRSGAAFGITGVCFGLPLALLLVALVMTLIWARYAISGDFASMFQFSEIAAEARAGIGVILLTALLVAVTYAIAGFAGTLACFFGLLVTIPYAYLVQAHLLGMMYREIRGTPPIAAPPMQAF